MELVEGTNLEDELQAGRRFNWRETTQLGIKLCRALKHAHDHGVIHRDLKPANLLLTSDGDIKLADFGIARLFGNTRLTSDGGVIGTAEYMAPEQADGRPVTDRCDQYSLGGVLYAMLAGRPPFRGGSLPELLQYHRYSEPPRVSRLVSHVPEELDQIITRLLSKDPQARATNALVVARQLAAMEHALSVPRLAHPPTARAKTSRRRMSAFSRLIPEPTELGRHMAPLPRSSDADDDGLSINTARTLSDPQFDPEATEPGRPIVEHESGRDAAGNLGHSLPDPLPHDFRSPAARRQSASRRRSKKGRQRANFARSARRKRAGSRQSCARQLTTRWDRSAGSRPSRKMNTGGRKSERRNADLLRRRSRRWPPVW